MITDENMLNGSLDRTQTVSSINFSYKSKHTDKNVNKNALISVFMLTFNLFSFNLNTKLGFYLLSILLNFLYFCFVLFFFSFLLLS